MVHSLSWQAAHLFLKTGESFAGMMPASQKDIYYGEVVFNTGMTGYIETLTDPSYAEQLLCFTYPIIGNYGVTPSETWESSKIQVAGVILSELNLYPTRYASTGGLYAWLMRENIPLIVGVDTRRLVHRLRNVGVVIGALTTHPLTLQQQANLEDSLLHEPRLASRVSIKVPEYETDDASSTFKTIIVVDCGLKNNIIRCLKQFDLRIKRVPFDYDYTQEDFDGVLLSNGPGDPILYQSTITILKKAMSLGKPIFGICLGSQLMALAAGGKNVKLEVGHRAQNQPCLCLPENRAYLTSQNHGYSIQESSLPPDWQVLYRNLNDGTVAGIQHQTLPFFSVQFHPEAAPGPVDTQYLFEKFYQLVQGVALSQLF